MADEDTRLARIMDMRQRTVALITDAGELRDDFLQYLYGLALKHLEELAGISPEEHGDDAGRSDDATIQEMADRLRSLSKRKS